MLPYDLYMLDMERDQINVDSITLSDPHEIRHIRNVRRMGVGDLICLTDDIVVFTVEITTVEAKRIHCTILDQRSVQMPEHRIILAPALLKGSHFDLMIEKAVELGVHHIQPIVTERTIAVKNKLEKWQTVIRTARKQCKQSIPVSIAEPVPLTSLDWTDGMIQIAAEIGDYPSVDTIDTTASDWMALIGPEGGFTATEIEYLLVNGARLVNLGPLRLRAETAAWKILSILNR